jgi:hypothetical protein
MKELFLAILLVANKPTATPAPGPALDTLPSALPISTIFTVTANNLPQRTKYSYWISVFCMDCPMTCPVDLATGRQIDPLCVPYEQRWYVSNASPTSGPFLTPEHATQLQVWLSEASPPPKPQANAIAGAFLQVE